MDAADIAWLRSPGGSAAAAEAATLLSAGSELTALRRLGHTYTPQQARAAVSLALGRRAAATKFEDADRLFCDREAAEQAGHELVACHIAARFAGMHNVADLGCGMGGDAMAITEHARVLAIDRDPARLAMLAANAEVRGVSTNVALLEADLAHWSLPSDIDALWADPARRDANGRRLGPESWSPPLSRVLELASDVSAAGIKLAPGIDLSLLPADAEVEFVSLRRDMKAAVLWTGSLVRARRTATVLHAGVTLQGDPDEQSTRLGEPGRYLYDPDPAIGRAGLVETLAAELGAWKLDERIAYLTSYEASDSPFARRLRVHSWCSFSERRLVQTLREAGFARVEVTRRGSPVETNALERRLNATLRSVNSTVTNSTAATAIVVLTRYRGEHIALICERETTD